MDGEKEKIDSISVVGGIIKMKKTTIRSKKVETLLYSKLKGNTATVLQYMEMKEKIMQERGTEITREKMVMMDWNYFK